MGLAILGSEAGGSKLVVILTIFQESHIDPDPDIFERYRNTLPMSKAMFLQKDALFWVGRK